MPNLLPPLGLPVQDVSSGLRELVFTFRYKQITSGSLTHDTCLSIEFLHRLMLFVSLGHLNFIAVFLTLQSKERVNRTLLVNLMSMSVSRLVVACTVWVAYSQTFCLFLFGCCTAFFFLHVLFTYTVCFDVLTVLPATTSCSSQQNGRLLQSFSSECKSLIRFSMFYFCDSLTSSLCKVLDYHSNVETTFSPRKIWFHVSHQKKKRNVS